jgi:hypothetical protein
MTARAATTINSVRESIEATATVRDAGPSGNNQMSAEFDISG